MTSAVPRMRVTGAQGQLLAVCCGFISDQGRVHVRPHDGCLDDSGVMSEIRTLVASQRIPQIMPPFSTGTSELKGEPRTIGQRVLPELLPCQA